jgi:hypothetical protein
MQFPKILVLGKILGKPTGEGPKQETDEAFYRKPLFATEIKFLNKNFIISLRIPDLSNVLWVGCGVVLWG